MKRDLDIVRAILLSAEEEDNSRLEEFDDQVVGYHAKIMHEAGLIDAQLIEEYSGGMKKVRECRIKSLTWDGHDYIDAMRDDNIWNKTKELITSNTTSWTFSILLEALKHELKTRIGLP